jgi:hypothetical protein
MRDLASGEKKPIYCDEVKFLFIPQYETLKLDLIIDYGLSKQAVVDCLPILREIRKLPRQFVINTIFTLVGEDFNFWVRTRILERNAKLATDKNLNIKLDHRIAQAYMNSTAVSRTVFISSSSILTDSD